MAAKGYPGDYAKGTRIEGLEEAAQIEGVEIFQAGTIVKGGALLANGGRVLNVCASGKTVVEARQRPMPPSTGSNGRKASAGAILAGRRSNRNRR